MVVRVVLVAALALAAMTAIANGTLRRTGVTSSCSVVRTAVAGVQLESCHRGWFDGYPNLTTRGCTTVSVTGRDQIWSCPVPSSSA